MYKVYQNSLCDHCPSTESRLSRTYGIGGPEDQDVLAYCIECLKIMQEKEYRKHVENGNIRVADVEKLIQLEKQCNEIRAKLNWEIYPENY